MLSTYIHNFVLGLGLLIFIIAISDQAVAMRQQDSPVSPIESSEVIEGDLQGTIEAIENQVDGSVELPPTLPLATDTVTDSNVERKEC